MKLDYLVLSDIHLGHKRNKTADIIKNLDRLFDNYSPRSKFTGLDMIIIAGDLFDGLLDFSTNDIHEAVLWIGRLMVFCAVHKIKLRILEGTPSHDWKQSRTAEMVQTFLSAPCDFRYIDTLHIEYLSDLQLHILYVPDEWTASTDLTFEQVKELMAKEGIREVDIAIMHGLFGYQMKDIPGVHHQHSEANYLGIVRYFINIGHIHTFSTYDRIIAQGSTDRLSHGEEEAKGVCLMHIDTEVGNSFEFIENVGAKIFKTITLRSKDLDKSVAIIDRAVSKLPNDSYVRIKAAKDHPVYIAFDDLKLRHPMLTWSKKADDDQETKQVINLLAGNDNYVPINITPDNIVSLLMTEVVNRNRLEPSSFARLESVLVTIRDSQ